LLLVAPASRDFAGHPPSPNFGAQASRPLSASATTDSLTPDEGWMERRQAHSLTSVAPAKRDPLSRGDRDLSRRSTVAIFGCGPTKPAPGSGTGAAATARAKARNARRSGSGPPAVRSRRSVGRHSLLRLSGSFLENAPLSQDVNPVPQTRYVVNEYLRIVDNILVRRRGEMTGRALRTIRTGPGNSRPCVRSARLSRRRP
jgi:hypothetical protein